MFLVLKVLRPKLVDEKFVKNLGEFLRNVQLLDAGSTRIQSAAGLYSLFASLHDLGCIVNVGNVTLLFV